MSAASPGYASPAWMAVLTIAWVAPIAGFAVRHLDRPPDGAALALFIALGSAAALVMAAPPARLFRLRDWERDGARYRALGVRRFRRVVPYGDAIGRPSGGNVESGGSGGSGGNGGIGGSGGNGAGMGDWHARGVESERAHWCFLLAGAAFALWAWRIGRPGFTLYLTAATVPFNVYPILLQRYTRGRLVRVAQRRGRRRGRGRRDARRAIRAKHER